MANATTAAAEVKDFRANEEIKEDKRKLEETVTSPVKKKSEKGNLRMR